MRAGTSTFRSKLQRILQLHLTKKIISGIVILFALIIFHIPIEIFLSRTVVEFILSNVPSIWYNNLIFLLIAGAISLFTYIKFEEYTPSINFTVLLSVALTIYILYRSSGSTWEFTAFAGFPKLKYADLLIFASLCQILLFIRPKNSNRVDSKKSFIMDASIGADGKDELGYSSYAKLLADRIRHSNFDKSYAIGINGKWGLGKTSFIDLIKRSLNGDDMIEVNFNPWNSHTPKAIIKDFFETFQEAIRPYHSSLSRQFIEYSNKLVALNSNTLTQSIQTTVWAFTGFETIYSLHQGIDNALGRIHKKIVIYIDDLDRLDKHEIIEIIRLIRNTANFRNTFFIVAYDRNYVVNALEGHNSYRQEEFLEKIFQLEVNLPYFKKDVLRHKLAEILITKLDKQFHHIIEREVIGTYATAPLFLNEWLESMRDVTRLANALLLNFEKLAKEVDFCDMIRLEILRLKYPAAYELLFRKTMDFMEIKTENSANKNFYQLKSIPKRENSNEMMVATNFERFIRENHRDLSIPLNEIPRITKYVEEIFCNSSTYLLPNRSHLSVIYPSKFERYFAYGLVEGNLSEIEFSEARTLSQKQFNEKITMWIADRLEIELKNRFIEIKSFDDREDYEKVIRAIFHMARQPSLHQDFYFREIVGFDSSNLIGKISNYQDEIVVQCYPLKDGHKIFKNFIKQLFDEAKSPFLFEAELLRELNKYPPSSFALTEEEIKEKSIQYFKRYCLKTMSFDSKVWHLFNCTKQTERIPNGPNQFILKDVIPEESKNIMKDFVLNKDLDGFILAMIEPLPFKAKTYKVNNFVLELFNSWGDFETDLERIDDNSSSYMNEFKEFLVKFAVNNYSNWIEFEFKTIPT